MGTSTPILSPLLASELCIGYNLNGPFSLKPGEQDMP